MVRYLFYTIGDLTYQSPLVYRWEGWVSSFQLANSLRISWRKRNASRFAIFAVVITKTVVITKMTGDSENRCVDYVDDCRDK